MRRNVQLDRNTSLTEIEDRILHAVENSVLSLRAYLTFSV